MSARPDPWAAGYSPLATYDMEECFLDEHKFEAIPWEDRQ